jgi:hypothetical protein
MAAIRMCNPCQIGDHKHHYRIVQAVSEGMLGGAICDCKGECQDKKSKPSFLIEWDNIINNNPVEDLKMFADYILPPKT